jgi:hypothetical protein
MKHASFSFCESVAAGPRSLWHIRRLTEKGYKYGGGIDTGSLCGHVKEKGGWDLHEVDIDVHHLEKNTCGECRRKYLETPRWLSEEECKELGDVEEKHGPLYRYDDQWYYNDETWSELCGPFTTREEADKACEEYARQL